MIYLWIYLTVGLLLYPMTMDMWYRVCYKRQEWYNPNQVFWYLGFITYVLFWVIVTPFIFRKYFKEMSE